MELAIVFLSDLVAKERINTLGWSMAFIRIRSPSKAPPVFLLLGSTETMAMVLVGFANKKYCTNLSQTVDFPAPPVPVSPMMGIFCFVFLVFFFVGLFCKSVMALLRKRGSIFLATDNLGNFFEEKSFKE